MSVYAPSSPIPIPSKKPPLTQRQSNPSPLSTGTASLSNKPGSPREELGDTWQSNKFTLSVPPPIEAQELENPTQKRRSLSLLSEEIESLKNRQGNPQEKSGDTGHFNIPSSSKPAKKPEGSVPPESRPESRRDSSEWLKVDKISRAMDQKEEDIKGIPLGDLLEEAMNAQVPLPPAAAKLRSLLPEITKKK